MDSNAQNPIGAIINLNDYPPEQYNVLAPVTMIQATSNLQRPEMKVVTLDTRTDRNGDIIGSDVYKERSSGKFAVTKVGGAKLAAVAGITIVSSESVQPDVCTKCIEMAKAMNRAQPCGTCPHQYDVKYKVIVSVPSPSGEIRYIAKDKEIDCAMEKETMKPEQYKRFLPHRASHAESKAFMRCLRDALGLAAGYTLEQLRKPFVIARMVPNLDAPEIREALAGNYLQSMGLLFETPGGHKAALPANTTPVRQEPPALPAAENFNEGDYSTSDDNVPLPWDVAPDPEPEPEPRGPQCEGCGYEIPPTTGRNGQNWSPEAIARFSVEKFGRQLCIICQEKANATRGTTK